jgi:hypothetical protein
MTALPHRRRGLGPAEREPRWTIYVSSWVAARECAAVLPRRLRRLYGECLDYMEAGWAIMRTVALAAEDTLAEKSFPPDTYHVCTFIEAELVDIYRGVAFARRDRVPGYTPEYGLHGDWDAVTEAEYAQRLFHILGLAAGNPSCPPRIREVVPLALLAFDRWLEGLPRIMAPVYECETRELRGMPLLQWEMGRLRGAVRRRPIRPRYAPG